MSWLSDFFDDPDPPPAPDYSPIINAQAEQARYATQLAKEQFEWGKQIYAENKGVTDAINQRFMSSMDEQLGSAREDRERYETTFQPVEDRFVADAEAYDSPERRDLMRGRARAQVAQDFDAQRQNSMRELESFGINPGAVRYAGLDIGVRTAQAATEAAAANQADLQTEDRGLALRREAIALGQRLPGQSQAEYSGAGQAGVSGANTALATTASGANVMGTGSQWFGAGTNTLAQQAATTNTGFQNQLDAYKADAESSSGFGQALGLGLGIAAKKTGFLAGGGAIPMPGMDNGEGMAMDVPEQVPAEASPSGGKAIDDVPARLTPGEFVIPVDVAQWYGEEKLQKLIQKAREAKKGAPAKPQMRQAVPTAPTFNSPSQALPTR